MHGVTEADRVPDERLTPRARFGGGRISSFLGFGYLRSSSSTYALCLSVISPCSWFSA
jgi:hypothetical protein